MDSHVGVSSRRKLGGASRCSSGDAAAAGAQHAGTLPAAIRSSRWSARASAALTGRGLPAR